jgi:hypothetical protein
MQAKQHFAPDILSALEQLDEVEIEPRSADGRAAQPVTIWVVVVDGRQVYVRSYRGPSGRWYQALLEHPLGVLHAGQRQIPFRAVHVDDPEIIARVNDAYRRKYERKWPNETAEMLRDEVLSTTLRLDPVDSGA